MVVCLFVCSLCEAPSRLEYSSFLVIGPVQAASARGVQGKLHVCEPIDMNMDQRRVPIARILAVSHATGCMPV